MVGVTQEPVAAFRDNLEHAFRVDGGLLATGRRKDAVHERLLAHLLAVFDAEFFGALLQFEHREPAEFAPFCLCGRHYFGRRRGQLDALVDKVVLREVPVVAVLVLVELVELAIVVELAVVIVVPVIVELPAVLSVVLAIILTVILAIVLRVVLATLLLGLLVFAVLRGICRGCGRIVLRGAFTRRFGLSLCFCLDRIIVLFRTFLFYRSRFLCGGFGCHVRGIVSLGLLGGASTALGGTFCHVYARNGCSKVAKFFIVDRFVQVDGIGK